MIPIRDDNPQILMPIATIGIISLNVLAWAFLQGFGVEPALTESVCKLGLIPVDLMTAISGAVTTPVGPETFCTRFTGDESWPTVFTSMFMHGGWFHIIGNMWFLWIFGDNVEDSMGHVRFVIFYLLCGLGAAGLQIAANPESAVPMVGASGAIGGVMGAYIVLYPRVHVHMLVFLGFFATTFAVPAMLMLGYWIVMQLVGGFGTLGASGGGVAFWAHVGGFVAGALLVLIFRDRELLQRHPYHGWKQPRSPTKNWRRIKRR
ncbi:MAG: rhomboid family intramembrane serine protease [Woeseiaceae bacterium]|nr:rhomboid family intramembrane serine protease [Woeseiaceae bacterium]